MSVINPDPNMTEVNLFKDELLGNIHDLEKKLNERINNIENRLITDLDKFSNNMNIFLEKNKDMVLSVVSQKLKLDKISELETFKKKVDDMLITHGIRIKNNLDDISKMKVKYDKIVSENLYVPGFIGSSCQYRNLSEYLSHNISEVSKIRIEKDQIKRDIKDLKGKSEGLMKNMISLNDTSVQLCNKYTDNKQKDFQRLLDSALKEVTEKNLEMRTLMVKFETNIEKSEKRTQEEVSKLSNMKEDIINLIYDKYDNKLDEFKKNYEELDIRIKDNIDNINDNINIFKTSIESVNEQIKDLNQKNKDIMFQMRNYYCVSNKITNLIEQLNKKSADISISKLKSEVNMKSNAMTLNKRFKRRSSVGENPNSLKLTLDDFQPAENTSLNSIENKKINDDKKIINNKVISFKIDENKNMIKNKILSNKIEDVKNQNNFATTNITNKNETSETESSVSVSSNIINKKNIENFIISDYKTKNKNFNKEIVSQNINKSNQERSKSKNRIQGNNYLPLLTINNKEESTLDDIIKVKIIEPEINKSDIVKGGTKIKKLNSTNINNFYNNNNINSINSTCDFIGNEINNSITNIHSSKIKNKKVNQKKDIRQKTDLQLIEKDKEACKLVTLNLPSDSFKEPVSKKSDVKVKLKSDMINSLINSYRAKVFSKSHSPDEKIDSNNDIIDIPKKVNQAFGRTTYTFYFKKNVMNYYNANKNINNFGYNRNYKNYPRTINKINKTGH